MAARKKPAGPTPVEATTHADTRVNIPTGELAGFGRPIEPPDGGPPKPLRLDEPSPYTPPHGERLDPHWFTWN